MARPKRAHEEKGRGFEGFQYTERQTYCDASIGSRNNKWKTGGKVTALFQASVKCSVFGP